MTCNSTGTYVTNLVIIFLNNRGFCVPLEIPLVLSQIVELISNLQKYHAVAAMTRCPSVNVSFVAIGRLACTMALSRVKVRLHFSLITLFNENHLGCKGFFKRSICNRRVYRCSRDKQCMMSRKQRNRCQYCRLRKCLEQGMNRKGKTLLDQLRIREHVKTKVVDDMSVYFVYEYQ